MYKTFFTYNVSNVQYHLLIMPRTCFTCVNHVIFFLGLRPIRYCCKHFLLFVGYHLLSKGVTLGRISDLSHVTVVAYRRISAAVRRITVRWEEFLSGQPDFTFLLLLVIWPSNRVNEIFALVLKAHFSDFQPKNIY